MKITMPLLALLCGASCAAPTSEVEELGEVNYAVRGEPTAPTRYTVKNTNEQLKVCGGGVLLFNEPGFYYMGRAFDGWTIDAEAKYTSQDRQRSYLFGLVGGTVNACLWMGPPTADNQPGQNLGAVYTDRNGSSRDRCNRAFDALYDRDTIGEDFNCAVGQANGGSAVKLSKDTDLYYNLAWRGNFTGGKPQDHATRLPAGTEVAYRFRTHDGLFAVVQVEGHGWGFVDGASVSNPGCSGIRHLGCPQLCGSTDAACCAGGRCNTGLSCEGGACKAPPQMPQPQPTPTGSCLVHCVQCNTTNQATGPVVNLGTLTEAECRVRAPGTCVQSWTAWPDDGRVLLEPRAYCGIRCKDNADAGWGDLTERECRERYLYCAGHKRTARLKWGASYLYNADGC